MKQVIPWDFSIKAFSMEAVTRPQNTRVDKAPVKLDGLRSWVLVIPKILPPGIMEPVRWDVHIIKTILAVIAGATNNFGLRADDHLDTHTGATPIAITFASSASGIINSDSDRDVFKFDLLATNNFRLSAIPQNVGSGNEGANVDIRVALLDQNADTIGTIQSCRTFECWC